MADPADLAARESAIHDQARERAHAQRMALKPVHALTCEECDEPIPLARRQALADRDCLMCIECQSALEKHGGRHV